MTPHLNVLNLKLQSEVSMFVNLQITSQRSGHIVTVIPAASNIGELLYVPTSQSLLQKSLHIDTSDCWKVRPIESIFQFKGFVILTDADYQ